MALVFFDGFQDAQQSPKPEYVRGSNNWTNNTGRDGSTNGAAGAMGNAVYLPFTLGSPTLITGFGFMATGGQFGSTTTIHSYSTGATPTYLIHIGCTAAGYLEVRRGTTFAAGTTIAISSGHPVMVLNRWYHIQVKYIAHLTNGTLVVKLDGQTVINVTGVQTANVTGTPDRWYHNTTNNWGGNQWQYDDMWIADDTDGTATQGRPNSDFLGDLGVKTLLPVAEGDVAAWSKSTGTSGWVLVDESPPNTTDFVFSSTPGQQQLFGVSDLPASAAAVYGVRLNHYSLKSDAGASSVKPLLKEGGGTVTAQAAQPLSTTVANYSGPFLWTKPSAPGTAFDVSDVNALQVGVETG